MPDIADHNLHLKKPSQPPGTTEALGGTAINRPPSMGLSKYPLTCQNCQQTQYKVLISYQIGKGPGRVALHRLILLIGALACGFIITAHAGLRGPGKYCGVVVFDRWDTCFLLSGPYITYISEGVKNELRPYKGKAMQLDVLEVSQPQNPGDALVRKYKIIGPAPDTRHWVMLDGLELVAESDFGPHGVPTS